ncbi:MAG TPA: transglutaminase-like domain-containing protein, partial [Patescibacteria group bacterium]|nr:transglutaminase-like domain-containing protein [Patescibacteria group bacterium]
IEINGVLCGYAEFDIAPIEKDGRELILLKEKMFAMLTALGMAFNTEVKLTYHVDPATGRFTYHESDVKQGEIELDSAVFVEGDTIRVTSSDGGEKLVPIAPGVVLENTLFFPHLVSDFVDAALEEKTYDIFEVRDAVVQKTTYTKAGTEELKLAGNTYNAIILDEMNLSTDLKIKWWIDAETGRMLKVIPIGNRLVYLAKPSIVKKIKNANIDELIMSRTNVTIADIAAISYMKVRAVIEPVGLQVTPENLNVPGQAFAGTVKDNLIEGVFEIEHPRYGGTGAPPFPPDFSKDESLREFLEPGELIESDDPVLVEKAREITEGSKDSWEAAVRLSEWVAENISYAIPGGGAARRTYDMRAGECGAHSLLLAAFCRAVGIPARVIWGCMYTPNAGGSFGQHGWSEIYMGETGWIPVDATAAETDFVDSGHIRIGVMQSMTISFNPHEMEILDYRTGTGETSADSTAALGKYEKYMGEYKNVAQPEGSGLNIVVRDRALALDIPNKMVLALKDPDEEGRWYCTLSPRLFLTFIENDAGEVDIMKVHEIIVMPKKADPSTTSGETPQETGETAAEPAKEQTATETTGGVPEKFRPYLGTYHLAALGADFTVSYLDGGLAVYDPLEKATIKLQPPGEDGWRMDEFNKNRLIFEIDDEGNVTGLKVDSISTLRRK